jgi:uncharacterized protein (TIGR03083 family)
VVSLGPAAQRTRRTAELSELATTGIDPMDGYFTSYLPKLILAVVVPLAALVQITVADPVSGAMMSVALVATEIGLRLAYGHPGLRTGLLVLVLAPEAYLPLRALGAQFHATADGLAAADEVFAVLESETPAPMITARSGGEPRAITVTNVTVRHEGRAEPARSARATSTRSFAWRAEVLSPKIRLVDSVTDPGPWVRALRGSQDRLAGIVAGLDADALIAQSYDSEWSIADVLSHLGSGAEIFLLNLEAGLTGSEPPAMEDYQAIWDKWNALDPDEQAERSIAVNGSLVARVEGLSAEQAEAFRVAMFGRTLDLAGLLRLRLSEHAVHTWDIAVALDPSARVSQDAVALLIDGVAQMMPWMGKKADAPQVIAVATTEPDRAFVLDTGGVTMSPPDTGPAASPTGSLELTAEALLRLVYGRIGESAAESGAVRASNVDLADLRAVFPGF